MLYFMANLIKKIFGGRQKMEIIKDEVVREKFHAGFTRPEPPSEIVIHGTGGGGTLNYVRNGGRKELYKRGIALFHYLIERDGRVIEIINPDNYVYHSSSGKHDQKTIGIELLNLSHSNSLGYTKRQYESLLNLIEHLEDIYPLDRIVSHYYNSKKYFKPKNCPGNKFDTELLKKYLTKDRYIVNI